jgi:hypothetical protein
MDDCEIQLNSEFFAGDNDDQIVIDTDLDVNDAPLSIVSACYYEDSDKPHLTYVPSTNTLRLDGSLPAPYFTCDQSECGDSQFVKSEITLSSLAVMNLYNAKECCPSGNSTLDLCSGTLYLDAPGSSAYTTLDPWGVTQYDGSGGGFSMKAGNGQIYNSAGSVTIQPGGVSGDVGGASFSIGFGSLSVEGNGASFSYNSSGLYMDTTGGNVSIQPRRSMGVTTIQVCVNGETRSMDIIGSDLY